MFVNKGFQTSKLSVKGENLSVTPARMLCKNLVVFGLMIKIPHLGCKIVGCREAERETVAGARGRPHLA